MRAPACSTLQQPPAFLAVATTVRFRQARGMSRCAPLSWACSAQAACGSGAPGRASRCSAPQRPAAREDSAWVAVGKPVQQGPHAAGTVPARVEGPAGHAPCPLSALLTRAGCMAAMSLAVASMRSTQSEVDRCSPAMGHRKFKRLGAVQARASLLRRGQLSQPCSSGRACSKGKPAPPTSDHGVRRSAIQLLHVRHDVDNACRRWF